MEKPKEKECNKCNQVKSILSFSLKIDGKDNRCPRCRECMKIINKTNTTKREKEFGGLYDVWRNMKGRCLDLKDKAYRRYGGRGITICQKWKDSFRTFHKWTKDKYKKGLTIDRRNNDGNYTPENCRFVTQAENNRNTSRIKLNIEKVKTIRKLLRKCSLSQERIGEIFGVKQTAISNIKLEKRWI